MESACQLLSLTPTMWESAEGANNLGYRIAGAPARNLKKVREEIKGTREASGRLVPHGPSEGELLQVLPANLDLRAGWLLLCLIFNNFFG